MGCCIKNRTLLGTGNSKLAEKGSTSGSILDSRMIAQLWALLGMIEILVMPTCEERFAKSLSHYRLEKEVAIFKVQVQVPVVEWVKSKNSLL